MLRDSLFIAGKDVKYMFRAKETIIWVFVMPIVFFYFIGTITGGFAGGGTRAEKLAVKRGEQTGFLVDQLVHRLEERGYDVIEPESDSLFVRYARRLTIPTGFSDSVLAGIPVALKFERSESGLGFDYDALRINRAIFTVLADVIVTSELNQTPTPESFANLNSMPRALSVEVRPAGQRKIVPSGFEQAIPGIMVMFTLLIMTTSGAILLVIERRQGLLRRLAYTPISRLGVVLGKWGGKLVLGMVQIAFAMIAGTIFFKMDWGANLAMVIVVMFTYGGLMASTGMVLGSLARTEGQAAGIGVVSANVLAALGGCWWPIEVTPAWMQKLQLFLPTGWAMDALHKLVSFAAAPTSVIPHLIVMFVVGCILLIVSARVFRFE
ncbi:MAG: ABC transporter permease [Candidatus Latescibacterota bacterium]|nr:MAG: ABC transporter permease [Candidatus Latescibacterota bacterium]